MHNIDLTQVKLLKKELGEVEAQLARVEKLLRIADPDGWLKPGSKAAAVSAVGIESWG